MATTPHTPAEKLELLKFELGFLESGGYGRPVRTPWQATSIFRDSPSCLNFNDVRRHPCEECLLMDFVPPERRSDDMPCHQIVLNEKGDTVDSLYLEENQARLEERLAQWLRRQITQLESEIATSGR